MNGSAAAVGRIMAPLLGAPEADRETVAALGVAFQLTNFIRDVREDWEMDRIYLPGLGEDDLAEQRASDAFRERIGSEAARARALFADTRSVIGAVRPEMRTAHAGRGRDLRAGPRPCRAHRLRRPRPRGPRSVRWSSRAR